MGEPAGWRYLPHRSPRTSVAPESSRLLRRLLCNVFQVLVLTGKEPGMMHKLGIGAFAGLVAQSCTYPLEVTRRRMQTHGLVDTHAGVHKVREWERTQSRRLYLSSIR